MESWPTGLLPEGHPWQDPPQGPPTPFGGKRKRFMTSEGWSDPAMKSLVGDAGPYALGHVASRERWVCSSGMFVLYKSEDNSATFRRYIRCRQCDGCRSYKRAMWCARAIHESVSAAAKGRRTWVLTATHRIRPTEGGDDLFAREITLALKRLRQLAAFRYMIVFERHKARTHIGEAIGYPHCHGLIHEVDRILFSDFAAVFPRIGFYEAKLLKGDPAKAAGYVGKYITKGDNPKRIRASVRYGGQGPAQPQSSTDEAFSLRKMVSIAPEFAPTHAPGAFSPEVSDECPKGDV